MTCLSSFDLSDSSLQANRREVHNNIKRDFFIFVVLKLSIVL